MQLISKCNKKTRFLLMCCTFEKQKRFTITNVFQEKLDKSGHKSNKIWVDKGSEFYE